MGLDDGLMKGLGDLVKDFGERFVLGCFGVIWGCFGAQGSCKRCGEKS